LTPNEQFVSHLMARTRYMIMSVLNYPNALVYIFLILANIHTKGHYISFSKHEGQMWGLKLSPPKVSFFFFFFFENIPMMLTV